MASEWELITAGLAAYLTDALRAAYTADCFAEDVTSGAHDWQTLDPGFTPAIAIWQLERTQPDPDVPSYLRSVRLVALIRRKAASAAVMQTDGNELERNLDTWFRDPLVLGGSQVSIFHGSGQTSTVDAGDNECLLDYYVTVKYRQSLY